ncbi:hypothetical protein [Sphingomonas chungangi]|uniref:hypothetical protein n=1 Tax=Sphingomonas chungangi TaxID=2683589 RepID=UPI001FE77591|nr:hypothetical protein [Sphingomonas chungangi]
MEQQQGGLEHPAQAAAQSAGYWWQGQLVTRGAAPPICANPLSWRDEGSAPATANPSSLPFPNAPFSAAAATLPPPPDAATIRLIEALLDKQPVPADLRARMADPDAMAERRGREVPQRAEDWPALARYRVANGEARDPELVMIGPASATKWHGKQSNR